MRSTSRKTVPVSDDQTIHDSSGNIFADLSLPEAELRLAKAELVRLIRTEIKARKLTQTRAGTLLGIPQPDVSDLMRGRLARFSMERLERFLNALNMDIRIQVAARPTWKAYAGVSVEFVAASAK